MKFSGLILAGGQSKRFGSPKGLIPFENTTFISKWFELLNKIGCQNIIIIVNEGNQGVYRKALEVFPDTVFLIQRNSKAPLFSSLKIGLNFIENLPNEDGFVLTLVDTIPCEQNTLSQIITTAQSHSRAHVIRPVYDNKRGHPIFIKKEFYKSILEKDADSTRLDHMLAEANHLLKDVNVNDRQVATNINEPKDLS